jgi:modulator of FtsH protease HflK
MPDFEEIKAQTDKLKNITPRKFVTIAVIIAVVIFIFTGLYTVNPEEVGVIQRFGKYTTTTEP